jgi:hypothetical protein
MSPLGHSRQFVDAPLVSRIRSDPQRLAQKMRAALKPPCATGMGSGATKSTNTGEPNGTVGGPTSLGGTGSSQYGGSTPGTANGK